MLEGNRRLAGHLRAIGTDLWQEYDSIHVSQVLSPTTVTRTSHRHLELAQTRLRLHQGVRTDELGEPGPADLPPHLSAARSRSLSLLLCFSFLFFISSSSSSFSATEKSLQDPLRAHRRAKHQGLDGAAARPLHPVSCCCLHTRQSQDTLRHQGSVKSSKYELG